MTYRFCESLASGGMAEVYLGVHAPSSGLERPCVLKVIRNEWTNHHGFREMFLEEVKILLHLQHSSIAQFIDFFDMDGTPVLVLEYIMGTSLIELISTLTKQGMLLPPVLSMHIMLKVAEALSYIHNFKDPVSQQILQVIHRDISPSNILVSFEGEIKLIDFGVAKYATKSDEGKPGMVKGKPLYMSPEQKLGLELSPKSDIFSFGIVFCELIRGVRFHTEGLIGQDDIQFNLTEIHQISHAVVAELIEKCLNFDPHKRPDATQVARILSQYIAEYGGGVGNAQLASFLKSKMAVDFEFEKQRLSKVLKSKAPPQMNSDQTQNSLPKDKHISEDNLQNVFAKNLEEIIEGNVKNAEEEKQANAARTAVARVRPNPTPKFQTPRYSQPAQKIHSYNTKRPQRWSLTSMLLAVIFAFLALILFFKSL